jgi:hypothetical protein
MNFRNLNQVKKVWREEYGSQAWMQRDLDAWRRLWCTEAIGRSSAFVKASVDTH